MIGHSYQPLTHPLMRTLFDEHLSEFLARLVAGLIAFRLVQALPVLVLGVPALLPSLLVRERHPAADLIELLR